MTPLQIDILLNYYTTPVEYGRADDNFGAPAVQEAINWMIGANLLENCKSELGSYRTTDRGKAYVDGLCNMPLPVQKWYVPSKEPK